MATKLFSDMVNKSEKVLVLNSSSKNYVEKINSGKADLCPNFVLTNQISDYHKIRDRIEKVMLEMYVYPKDRMIFICWQSKIQR